MALDITALRAWMADHVFLSVGLAIAFTIIAIYIVRDASRQFHLRMLQSTVAGQIALGGWAAVTGIGMGNYTIAGIGAGVIALGALAYTAALRLKGLTSTKPSAAPHSPGK